MAETRHTERSQMSSREKEHPQLLLPGVNAENVTRGTEVGNGQGFNDSDVEKLNEKAEASLPETSQRFVFGIRWFVANLALLYFFQFSMIVYLFGVIRTMERRFGLDSRESGVILIADDVVQICVITFTGHFGKRVSKPRIIGLLAISFAVGAMTLALPHFLYGAQAQSTILAQNVSYGGQIVDNLMYCDASNDDGANECDGSEEVTRRANGVAYGLFIIGQMFVGLGYSSTTVLGLSYIDENSPKNKSSLYIGKLSFISYEHVMPMISRTVISSRRSTCEVPSSINQNKLNLILHCPCLVTSSWIAGTVSFFFRDARCVMLSSSSPAAVISLL